VGAPGDVFEVDPVFPNALRPVAWHTEMSSRESGRFWRNGYDGETGERFKSGWSHMRFEEVEARRLREKRPPQVATPKDLWMVAVLDDGAVIGIRDRRALVRVHDGKEERLFPR
jgi:hypothetical protein